jgi:hypothetical protein
MSAPAVPGSSREAARKLLKFLGLTAAAVITASLPIVFGLVMLISAALHRPLVASVLRRWPRLAGPIPPADPARLHAAAARLTIVWGIGLVIVGLLQGIGAVTAGLSVTNPASLAIRTLAALLILVVMAIRTVTYLKRAAR